MFKGVTEIRTLPYLTREKMNESVTANSDICEITGRIENNDVTFISLQCSFSVTGKLYIVDENDNKMYLTDSSVDYPAEMQILSTFIIPKGNSVYLRYTADAIMSNLIIVAGGGVF